MASRKYRPTPLSTPQRAEKTTSLFIKEELNIFQIFNDRMFKRHHRDAVWGWRPNRYLLLVPRVLTSLRISLRNKENVYLLSSKLSSTHNSQGHLSHLERGSSRKAGSKVTFVTISPGNISTVGADGIPPFSRSLRNLKKKNSWQRSPRLHLAPSSVDNGGKWSSRCWGASENSEAGAGL